MSSLLLLRRGLAVAGFGDRGWVRSGEGLDDVVEVGRGCLRCVRGRGISRRRTKAMIGHGEEGVGLEEEVDGLGLAFGGFDGVGEEDWGVGLAVDPDDLLAGEEFGLVGGREEADVRDGSFGVEADAEGVPDVGAHASPAVGRIRR